MTEGAGLPSALKLRKRCFHDGQALVHLLLGDDQGGEQAQAGAMVPTVRAAPAALPAAPAAPGIAEMEAETRRNNSRLKLAQMWLAMAETAGKAKKAHYRQCAENALLGKA